MRSGVGDLPGENLALFHKSESVPKLRSENFLLGSC